MRDKKKTAKAPAKRKGSGRMYDLGYRPILVWVDATEKELLEAAAKKEYRLTSQFVRHHAIAAAKILAGRTVSPSKSTQRKDA